VYLPPQNSGPCNSFYCLGHFKNVYDDDDDDDEMAVVGDVVAAQTSADLSSSDSLLDTPVPDTPDVPLSPLPAFFTAANKTQSVDQLNRAAAAADADGDDRHARTR